jgi:hypothetical protein
MKRFLRFRRFVDDPHVLSAPRHILLDNEPSNFSQHATSISDYAKRNFLPIDDTGSNHLFDLPLKKRKFFVHIQKKTLEFV